MSDNETPPEQTPASAAGQAGEIEIDLAAFLPEGVVLGSQAPSEPVLSADSAPSVDVEALAQIERDLDGVDAAIAALDAGTYGVDPVSGQPIPDALLAEDPTRLS